MNDEQLFEEELGKCRPLEPSLRLQRAIAAQLDPAMMRRAVRRQRVLWLAAGCAAAACLVLGVALVHRQPGDRGPLPIEPAQAASAPLTPAPGVKHPAPERDKRQQAATLRLTPKQVKTLPPTEWGYELAAQSSPEDRVLFLEHQADVLLPDVEKDGS